MAQFDTIREALPGADEYEKTLNALQAVQELEAILADALEALRIIAEGESAFPHEDVAAAALARLDAT